MMHNIIMWEEEWNLADCIELENGNKKYALYTHIYILFIFTYDTKLIQANELAFIVCVV